MSDTVIVAIITASSSVLVSVTALLLNYRGFAAIDTRLASIDTRLASMEAETRELGQRVARLEERTPPLIHR